MGNPKKYDKPTRLDAMSELSILLERSPKVPLWYAKQVLREKGISSDLFEAAREASGLIIERTGRKRYIYRKER